MGNREGAWPGSVGPLVGVRVIDLGTMFAGPFAASLLADFGADVIKVELPGVGDSNRGVPPVVKGISGAWVSLSRNKRSISLDIRKEKGRELLKRLVTTADVVVENFRPGTLERWGLGYEVLKQFNPKLILVRVSGFGQTGPYSHRAGFATVGAAFSGLTYLQGDPDRPPANPPGGFVDYIAGTFGAMAALLSLHHVKVNGGEGQQADIALYEAAFRLLELAVMDHAVTGRARERMGSIGQGSTPSGSFQCSDGNWVAMTCATDRTFNKLAEVMGRPELPADPRFDTNAHRADNRSEITTIVRDWFSQRTMAEAVEVLDRNGVAVSPINSTEEIFRDPQYRARENLVEVDHPVLGKVIVPGIVPKLSSTSGAIRFPGPVAIGEHNRDIYEGELGLSQEELETLRGEGVI